MRNSIIGVILMFIATGSSARADSPTFAVGKSDARTPEAVKAADAAWLDAEINGDAKFLEWFLEDGYESIDSTGAILSKVKLIENRRQQGRSEKFAAAVREWREKHPNHAQVMLYGNTAVLTWVTDDPNSKTPVYSCDIFVYRDRHWHAIYSQHSNAEHG